MELIELTDGTYIEDILKLERECFTIPWSRNLFLQEFPKDYTYYVGVLEDGHIVGYGGMWIILDEGHITNVCVGSAYRRKGFAQAMIQRLIDQGERQGVYAMTLEVRRSNLAAQKLYESFGFKGVGYRRGYYTDNNEDALIMWRNTK